MRGWVYDRALIGLTSGWYREVLRRLPAGSHLLDVGIGTGGALLSCEDVVLARDLRVTGVDIDRAYVARARRLVARSGIADRVVVRHEALQEHHGGPYDAVYFAASFMLFPDPVDALVHARRLLTPGGQVLFTQTFQERPSATMAWLKPRLKRFTGIDFGAVTYEDDFLRTLEEGGLEVVEHVVIGGARARSSRLVVARPQGAGAGA